MCCQYEHLMWGFELKKPEQKTKTKKNNLLDKTKKEQNKMKQKPDIRFRNIPPA